MENNTKAQTQTFERFADAAFAEAQATYKQRGQEYADSWDLSNLQTPFLDLAHGLVADRPGSTAVTAKDKRLIAVAALCDVKLSRVGGGYKKDTLIDFINYLAFMVTAIDDLSA
jgi:hypothetical protein